MSGYRDCIARIINAAGRPLSDEEVHAIFERIHRAALDIKAGRVAGEDVKMGRGKLKDVNADIKATGGNPNTLLQEAAQYAATQLEHEAAQAERRANLQLIKLGSRQAEIEQLRAQGIKAIDAPRETIARNYTGKVNVASLEQKVAGYRGEFERRLVETWDALGNDFLGFWQDRTKLLDLIRELRGQDTGNALARRGAQAFHNVAERMRQEFNGQGGDIGRLDDWGMPQHHSQEKVAKGGKQAWTDQILPYLDRERYTDEAGVPFNEDKMREFLSHAWDTIATNGHANMTPGKFQGAGARASRHAEHRQIHFKDAESTIAYWDAYGEKTALEILHGHVETMAKDIAFIEHFGPNPDMTWKTLLDDALKRASMADPVRTPTFEGKVANLQNLYNYAAGKSLPTYRPWLRKTADTLGHLNVAGKLGQAMLASFYGDKPMLEAVSHLNNLPMYQRWTTELASLDPTNGESHRALQRQGLMLDAMRSTMQRFGDHVGNSSFTGKIANAVMRMTGMNLVNEGRKGALGLQLMSAIGHEVSRGVEFDQLPQNDMRLLRNYGITRADWDTWKLAHLDTVNMRWTNVEHVLTPESISRITDDQLRAANVIGQVDGPQAGDAARLRATVKLLGAVNTESDFGIVTPGWRERAAFYSKAQRGTFDGEIIRSMLQFKSFPWAFFQREMDLVANGKTPLSKAGLGVYLVISTTLVGAMLNQTRDVLAGKDPRSMADRNWLKFWGAAMVSGGALSIYGDFLYGLNQTRYGSGWAEILSGPTIGPLLEMGLILPLTAARNRAEGKQTHLAAQEMTRIKGFIPGNNMWYTKAAVDHLIWQRSMEAMSPGYLSKMREQVQKDYNQQWWWNPGTTSPQRAPELARALAR